MSSTPRQRRPIRGFTLHRPWSWCVAHAGKRLENRGWRPPQWLVGGYLAIHGGRTYDRAAAAAIADELDLVPPPPEFCAEGIVAVARLAGCVTSSSSPWFSGPYGWQLEDVVVLAAPIECPGQQGLWPLGPELLQLVRRRWDAAVGRTGL